MTDKVNEEFDVDMLIKKACKMNLPALIQYCAEQSILVEERIASRPAERETQFQIRRYRDFVFSLSVLLKGYKAKPSGMRNEDFHKTKVIFESLIAKKQVDAGQLSLYDGWDPSA